MIRPRTEASVTKVANALISGWLVWLLVEVGLPVAMHVGTEAVVRAALLEWLGEEDWPAEWALVPVSAGRAEAALADARREVAELDARCDRLAGELAAARRALADRERLAAGPALRETPEWPDGLAGLAAREAGR